MSPAKMEKYVLHRVHVGCRVQFIEMVSFESEFFSHLRFMV